MQFVRVHIAKRFFLLLQTLAVPLFFHYITQPARKSGSQRCYMAACVKHQWAWLEAHVYIRHTSLHTQTVSPPVYLAQIINENVRSRTPRDIDMSITCTSSRFIYGFQTFRPKDASWFIFRATSERQKGVPRRQSHRRSFRPSDPALCGSCPLVTPYYCRLGDLLC